MRRIIYTLLLITCSVTSSWAGVTLHSSHSNFNSSLTATSLGTGTYVATTGDTLIVVAAFGSGASCVATHNCVTNVTDIVGNTYTPLCSVTLAGNVGDIEIYYVSHAIVATSANAAVTATVTYTAGSKAVVSGSSWRGVASINTTPGCSTASVANPSVSLSTTGSYNNACIGMFAGAQSTAITAATGTLATNTQTSSGTPIADAIVYNTTNGTGTNNCTTAISSSTTVWGIGQIELKSDQWGGVGVGGPVQVDINTGCTASTTSCTVPLDQAVVAGDLLIVGSSGSGVSTSISSVSDNGSTAQSWTTDANSACAATGGIFAQMAYVLSANSVTTMPTSVTINITSAPSGTWWSWAIEVAPDSSITPIAKDTDGNNNTSSTATTLAGPSLTLSGTNDFVVQGIALGGSTISSITQSYLIAALLRDTMARNVVSSYVAPAWSWGAAFQACDNAIAFKPNTVVAGRVLRHHTVIF